ncbi:hypothetical protein, partial [uncultured Deefgea sp.]|uniref:hypothetical protein n=1 Tax=uncultured Deefgea sp. TaxID=1304914 RepID=UPI0025915716
PSFNQNQNACQKLTGAGGSSVDTAAGVLSGFIEFPSIKRSHTPSMTARAAGKIDWTIDPLPYDLPP